MTVLVFRSMEASDNDELRAHSKGLPDSQSDVRSDIEARAKSTLKELKIAQENVGFGSATFPLHTVYRTVFRALSPFEHT